MTWHRISFAAGACITSFVGPYLQYVSACTTFWYHQVQAVADGEVNCDEWKRVASNGQALQGIGCRIVAQRWVCQTVLYLFWKTNHGGCIAQSDHFV